MALSHGWQLHICHTCSFNSIYNHVWFSWKSGFAIFEWGGQGRRWEMRGREEEKRGREKWGGRRERGENWGKGRENNGKFSLAAQEGSRETRGGEGRAGGGKCFPPSNPSYPVFIILWCRPMVYVAYPSSLSILHYHYWSAESHLFWLYTWSHLWFAGVRECPPWYSIVGATVTVHQFFCILLMPLYHCIMLCHFGGPTLGTCRFSVLWHRIVVCVGISTIADICIHCHFLIALRIITGIHVVDTCGLYILRHCLMVSAASLPYLFH